MERPNRKRNNNNNNPAPLQRPRLIRGENYTLGQMINGIKNKYRKSHYNIPREIYIYSDLMYPDRYDVYRNKIVEVDLENIEQYNPNIIRKTFNLLLNINSDDIYFRFMQYQRRLVQEIKANEDARKYRIGNFVEDMDFDSDDI